MQSVERSRANIFLTLTAVCYFLAFCLTLTHYGPAWDSTLGEFYIGDKNLKFFQTLNLRYLDYQSDNLAIYGQPAQPDYYTASGWGRRHPEHVWPLGPTLSALSREILHTRLGILGSVDAQHFFLVFFMLGLLWLVYSFTRKVFNPSAAAIAVLVLALHPRLLADAHNNIKDIPATALLTGTVILFYRAVAEDRRGLFAWAGLVWGFSLAAKANALFLPLIVLPWILLRQKHDRIAMSLRFFASGLLAAAVCLACWPYLLIDFPAHLLDHLRYLIRIGSAGSPGFSVVPSIEAVVTVPTVFLLFFLLGVLPVLFAKDTNAPGKRVSVLLFLWLVVPIARVSMPHSNDFDGIRHWMEYLVPFAIIAGVGASNALRFVQPALAQWLIVAMTLVPTVRWIAANHPHEICFYNSLIGGLPGAREKNLPQPTDYWGSSYRRGLRWINKNAPPDSTLTVGVADHIVQAVAKIWLRQDIALIRQEELEKTGTKSGYLMYITREERYSAFLRHIDETIPPVHTITVEGAPILKIVNVGGATGVMYATSKLHTGFTEEDR